MDPHGVRLFCESRSTRLGSVGRTGEAFYQGHAWQPPIRALLIVLVLASVSVVAWLAS